MRAHRSSKSKSSSKSPNSSSKSSSKSKSSSSSTTGSAFLARFADLFDLRPLLANLFASLAAILRLPVFLVSLDVYRPAAQEQLKVLAEANQINHLPVISGQQPIDITKRALNAATLNGSDIIIFDTAGRTQADLMMMNEIKQI